MRKSVISFFLTAVLVVTSIFSPAISAAAAYEPEGEINSQAAYMVNLDSGTVVFSKNERQKVYPASLVKIMTVMLVLETETDLQKKLTMSYAIRDELYGTGAKTIELQPGEEVTVEDLLYACMVPSACDAAAVLAEHYGGGNQAAFIEKMNEKAKELGANDTRFANAHGLHDENQYTTAYDLYLITKAALAVPKFEEISTTVKYTFKATNKHPEERAYTHTNTMLSTNSGPEFYYQYAKGIKTGTTDESGRNLISMASKDGFNYLLITTGAPSVIDGVQKNYPVLDHKKLYEWAFGAFAFTNVLTTTETVGTVKVRLSSDADTLQLNPKEKVTLLLPKDISPSSIQRITEIPESVDAPVEKGDVIGTVKLKLNDEIIGECELVASASVSKNFIYGVWDAITGFFGTIWAKLILAVIILLIVLYIVFAILYNRKKKKRRRGSLQSKKRRKR